MRIQIYVRLQAEEIIIIFACWCNVYNAQTRVLYLLAADLLAPFDLGALLIVTRGIENGQCI